MSTATRTFRAGIEQLEDRCVPSADVGLLDVTTTDFQRFDVRYSITGGDAAPFAFRAYLSADPTLGPDDTLLSGQQTVAAPEQLAAGSEPHQTALVLPSRAPIGEARRFVLVVADHAGGTDALFAVPLLAVGQTIDRNGTTTPIGAVTDEAGPFTGAILPGTADHARLASVDLATVWTPAERFQFRYTEGEPELWQRNEDRYAQPTVLAPLAQLVGLISADLDRVPALWGGAVFSINEAYDSLRQHAVAESRHYEGRALDLGIFDDSPGSAGTARLAGLSWLAGFDFVYNEDDHVHVSEHAAFATTINQTTLQQSVRSAFQLGRISSGLVATVLVRTLNGFDAARERGQTFKALAQLLLFRIEVQAAAGSYIRDTGFAELLLTNVDKLLVSTATDLLSRLPVPPSAAAPALTAPTTTPAEGSSAAEDLLHRLGLGFDR